MTQLQPLRNIKQILINLPVQQIQSVGDAKSFCNFIGRCVVPDLRFMAWDLEIASIDPWEILGVVSNPFGLQGLVKAAEEIGVPCNVDGVQVLPKNSRYVFGRALQQECPIYINESEDERIDTAVKNETLIVLIEKSIHSLVHIPNGYLGWIRNDSYQTITHEEWLDEKTLINKDSSHDTLQENAVRLLKTPYVWGGVSSEGIDCSGFTRFLYKSIGLRLPRDADQQFACGEICALPNRTEAITTGDLLFFSGEYGGISHIGMALNSLEFIHAKGGEGVIISKIDRSEALMNRFLLAKRIQDRSKQILQFKIEKQKVRPYPC